MLKIYPIKTDEDIKIAKELFTESNNYVRTILHKYDNFPWAIEYWQSRKEEVENLPGKYGSPQCCILIARYKDIPAGCVGLLEENRELAVMTYLYVIEKFRSLGIGKGLVKNIIEYARNAGYKSICLHTNSFLQPAISLYNSLGFEKVSYDKEYPEEIKDIIVHMELKIS